MVKFMIKNEKGYALVLVLIIMLIFLMLGTVLITVSTTQVKEAVKQQERVQAYYLAYSGAKATVDWITAGYTIPEGLSDTVTLDNGSFTVNVDSSDPVLIHITALGTVNGHPEEVHVTLTRQGGGSPGGFPFPTDMAVFSISDGSTGPVFTLSGSASVSGDVGTNTSVENTIVFGPSESIEVDGNLYTMIDPGDPDSDDWEAPDPSVYDEWDSAISYGRYSRVVYNGAVFEARDPTAGAQPGLMDSPWNEITNLWRDFNVYVGGDEVWYDGEKYRAKNWTKNDQPGVSVVWVSVSGLPFTQVKGEILPLGETRTYPQLIFPDFPTGLIDRGSYTAGWSPVPAGGHRISENGYYSSITVPNQLTIDVGNEDRILRIGTLDVQGGNPDNILINRTGNGRLILYVDNAFIFGGGATINNNGATEALIMYYAGSNAINFSGNERFFGNVFIKDANLTIGGSSGITGHILTGGTNVEINGAADAYTRLLYAPNAHISMTGSSTLKGSVISKSFDGGSGNRIAVTYEPIDESTFPFDFSLFEGGSSGNGGSGGNGNVTWNVLQWSGGMEEANNEE
jgi:hypothetical protein